MNVTSASSSTAQFFQAFKSLSPAQARSFLDIAPQLAEAGPVDVTALSSEAQFQKFTPIDSAAQASYAQHHAAPAGWQVAASRYNTLLQRAQTVASAEVSYDDNGRRHVQTDAQGLETELIANPETGSLNIEKPTADGTVEQYFHREGNVLTRWQESRSIRHLDPPVSEAAAKPQDQAVLATRQPIMDGSHPFANLFPPPTDLSGSLAKLRTDLAEVPVRGVDGRPTDVYQKLMAEPSLGSSQKVRILSALAEVRDAYLRPDDALPTGLSPVRPGGRAETRETGVPNKGYQVVNWKHTRGEIDQVLESARLNRLTPEQTEDALLGSIFSESVKTPENFAIHNVHGAQAAAEVLPRYLNDPPRLQGIIQAILEHQISPPAFMAMIISGLAAKALGHPPTDADQAALAEISAKISHPFDSVNLTPDRSEAGGRRPRDCSQIAFSDAAKQRLAAIGIQQWTVPTPGTFWYAASRSLIDGDCLINYSSPDGWAKIAAIRGPERGPFFEDATVWDSLDSSQKSYHDALSVMSAGARPLAEAGLVRTLAAKERSRGAMEAFFAKQDVPRNLNGTLPFWDAPLKYPSKGPLNELEQRQFNFAKVIRDKMVELMRGEQGNY